MNLQKFIVSAIALSSITFSTVGFTEQKVAVHTPAEILEFLKDNPNCLTAIKDDTRIQRALLVGSVIQSIEGTSTTNERIIASGGSAASGSSLFPTVVTYNLTLSVGNNTDVDLDIPLNCKTTLSLNAK